MFAIRFRSVFMGIFDHSSRSTFEKSDTDFGWEGHGWESLLWFVPKMFFGTWDQDQTPSSMYFCWNRKDPSSKFPQSWDLEVTQKVLEKVWRVPLTGTRGPNSWKLLWKREWLEHLNSKRIYNKNLTINMKQSVKNMFVRLHSMNARSDECAVGIRYL